MCGTPEILVLGSLPSDISIDRQEYYANPRNLFWKIIASATGSAVPFSYGEKKAMLAKNHIALWDVYSSADRQGSLDANIRGGQFNGISALLAEHPTISVIVLNGGKSATAFREYLRGADIDDGRRRGLEFRSCPSTSPMVLCSGVSFDDVVARWKDAIINRHCTDR